MLKRLKNSKFLKNASWIMIAQIFYLIISFIVTIISARLLKPDNYGVFNYCNSILVLFTSISTLSFDSIIVKELVNNKDNNGIILGSSIVSRILASLLVIILSVLLVILLKPGEMIYLTIMVVLSISLIFRSFEIIEFWFQSKLESKYSSLAKLFATMISATIKIGVLFLTKSLLFFSMCLIIDAIMLMMFYIYIYKNNRGPSLHYNKKHAVNLIKLSSSFIISTFFISLYSKIDQLMIGSMLPISYVGYYAVAVFFETSWYFIPAAIINSAKPIIFDDNMLNAVSRQRRIKQLYAFIFWLGILVAFAFSFLSKYVIPLAYGDGYLEAILPANIIMWSGAFAMTGSVRAIWLLCENKQKYTIFFVVFGAVVNVGINLLLIPTIGISGAAIATLLTQIIQVMICPLFFKKTRECTKVMVQGILFRW